MSRYIMIRRLRGPLFLMLAGVVALFHQMGLIDHFWHVFIPLLLIGWGVFMLAERAALAAEGGYPPLSPYPGAPYPGSYTGGQPYPGAPYTGAVDPNAAADAPQYAEPETAANESAPVQDFTQNQNGGQS